MQRHRNNGDCAGDECRLQGEDGTGQQASEDRGGWPDLVELEQVDQDPQGPVIAATGNRALEGRRSQLAKAAAKIT